MPNEIELKILKHYHAPPGTTTCDIEGIDERTVIGYLHTFERNGWVTFKMQTYTDKASYDLYYIELTKKGAQIINS